MQLVSRYRNRKYYWHNEHQYVTVHTFLNWDMLGVPYKIMCKQTKNDITDQTRTRIKAFLAYKSAYERPKVTQQG